MYKLFISLAFQNGDSFVFFFFEITVIRLDRLLRNLESKAKRRMCIVFIFHPFQNGGRLIGLFCSYGQTPSPIIMKFGINILFGTKVEEFLSGFLIYFSFFLWV